MSHHIEEMKRQALTQAFENKDRSLEECCEDEVSNFMESATDDEIDELIATFGEDDLREWKELAREEQRLNDKDQEDEEELMRIMVRCELTNCLVGWADSEPGYELMAEENREKVKAYLTSCTTALHEFWEAVRVMKQRSLRMTTHIRPDRRLRTLKPKANHDFGSYKSIMIGRKFVYLGITVSYWRSKNYLEENAKIQEHGTISWDIFEYGHRFASGSGMTFSDPASFEIMKSRTVRDMEEEGYKEILRLLPDVDDLVQ